MEARRSQIAHLMVHLAAGVTARVLDESDSTSMTTLLLLFERPTELLLILPHHSDRVTLALPRSLLNSLHCPNDLEFSSDPAYLLELAQGNSSIRKSGFIPVDLDNMLSEPMTLSLTETVSQI